MRMQTGIGKEEEMRIESVAVLKRHTILIAPAFFVTF